MTVIDWLQAGVQLQIPIVIVNLRNLFVISHDTHEWDYESSKKHLQIYNYKKITTIK